MRREAPPTRFPPLAARYEWAAWLNGEIAAQHLSFDEVCRRAQIKRSHLIDVRQNRAWPQAETKRRIEEALAKPGAPPAPEKET